MITIQSQKRLFIAATVFVTILFFILNIYTPLIADDFSYSNGIHSFSDIVVSQYNSYFNWGGRCVAHFIAQSWLLVGKPFFNIANTIVYCVFILLVQFHIKGNMKKPDFGLFLVLNIFFWFLVPAWGQNFLWLIGSCNYLWTTTIILFFLVPFRKRQDDPEYKLNIPLSVLFFLVSIFAGWSNENSGAAVLFLLIGYFIIKIIKKDKLTLFEILGAVGFLIGFFLMIAAPGNYVRAEVIRQMGGGYYNDLLLLMLIKRFILITEIFIRNHGALLVLISLFLGFDMLYNQKRKLSVFSYLYFLAILTSTYSMVLSPGFPDRAFFIVTVFSVITLGNILTQAELRMPEIIERNIVVLVASVIICLSVSFLDTSKKIIGVYLRWYDRIEYILTEKEKGNLEIEVNPIEATEKHVASYGLSDILTDENDWPNTSIAFYFGLKSIKSNDEPMETLWQEKGKRIRQLIIPPRKIMNTLQDRRK
jgi:hypothetical protein